MCYCCRKDPFENWPVKLNLNMILTTASSLYLNVLFSFILNTPLGLLGTN